MILGTGCLAGRALDGPAILAALRACGLDEVLLVASRTVRPRELAEVPAAGVRAHVEDAETAVAVARAARCSRLVLDLGERLDVEPACRALFALGRRCPGLSFALLTPAAGPLATPEALQLVLSDLASLPLGYWHRPARAARLGGGDDAFYDVLGRWLVGMSLDDVAGGEAGLPPGLGELDFGRAAELAGRSLVVALDVDPVPDPALLRPALDTLRRAGFA